MHREYKIKTRFRSMTLAEMMFSMALIAVFLVVSAPLVTMRAKLQGQDLASIMCIKNVLASDPSANITESECASKPDNPCCKAVKYCKYDQNNACSTLGYYADNGDSADQTSGKKTLSEVCNQGGKEGCKYFVMNCYKDNTTCNTPGDYNLQYYLNLPVDSSNLSKIPIINMAGALYNEESPNIVYWVNNTESCPTDNIAYYIRGLTCAPPPPPALGFPQMKLTPPDTSSQAIMGYSIKVDPSSGDVYMLGGYRWGHSGSTVSDIYLVKMNSSGSMESPYGWKKQIYSSSLLAASFVARGLAIDSLGNIYIGVRDETLISPWPLKYAYGMGVLKFNSDGTLLWQKRIKESSYDSGITDLAVSSDNNIYIAGFDPTGNISGDIIFVRMDTDGNINMQKRINSSDNKDDGAYGVAVDSSSNPNIYLAGYSNNGSNFDIAFLKMNSLGNITVQKRFNSSNNKSEVGDAIKLDSTASNAYIVGYTGTYGCTFGICTVDDGYFSILKLSTSNGSIGYQKVFNTTDSGNSHLTDLALDSDGNVYMVGYAHSSGVSLIVFKMSASGDMSSPNDWKLRLDGNSTSNKNDYGMGIAVGPDNYVYVTGFISASNILSDQGGMECSGPEAVLLKMSRTQTDQNTLFNTPTAPYNNISSPFTSPVNMNLGSTSPFDTFYDMGVTISNPGYTFNY